LRDRLLECHAFVNRLHPRLDVQVVANDTPVGQWVFRHKEPQTSRNVVIPKAIVAQKPKLEVLFRFDRAVSPASLGASGGWRELGVGAKTLNLDFTSGAAKVGKNK